MQQSEAVAPAARRATTRRRVPLTLAPGQFTPPGRWSSGILKFSQVQLKGDDRLVIQVPFRRDGSIRVSDTGFFGSSESIYFKLRSPVAVPWGPFDFEYEWFFLGITGELDRGADPAVDTGTVLRKGNEGLINASDRPRELELTNDTFSFTGIELQVTAPSRLPQKRWEIESVELAVAADSVK